MQVWNNLELRSLNTEMECDGSLACDVCEDLGHWLLIALKLGAIIVWNSSFILPESWVGTSCRQRALTSGEGSGDLVSAGTVPSSANSYHLSC